MASGWLGFDWGNVPGWVSATFTSASLSLAAVTYARNSRERAREQSERERAQAAKVSCWSVNRRLVLVRNSNEVSVLLRASVVRADRALVSEQVAFAPGETRGLRLPEIYDVVGEAPAVILTIMDSYGRTWSRAADGTLSRTGPASDAPAVTLDWESRA
jgi:hypothetical protein